MYYACNISIHTTGNTQEILCAVVSYFMPDNHHRRLTGPMISRTVVHWLPLLSLVTEMVKYSEGERAPY